MNLSINFHYKPLLGTIEICHKEFGLVFVISKLNWVLSQKLESSNLPVSEKSPQKCFLRSLVLSKAARYLDNKPFDKIMIE